MTLSPRERDIDAAVRAVHVSHHMRKAYWRQILRQPHKPWAYYSDIRSAFAERQSTRLAASTLSHCGHTQRKAKTDRVHDALRAVVG